MREYKKALRRLASTVLFITLILSESVFGVTISDINESAEPDAVQLVYELGLLKADKGKSNPQMPVTRAEYTDAVIRFLGLDADNYTSDRKPEIYDVTEYMDYSAAIFMAYDMGIVSGNGDGTFLPNVNITLNDAVVIMIKALGYDIVAEKEGGYPAGYLSRAMRLRLISGNMSGNDILSRDACACLLYNALGVKPIITFKYGGGEVSKTEGDKEALEEYHSVYKLEGLVKSQVYNTSDEEGEIITDNGVKFFYDGSDDYTGEYVKVYYRENKQTNRNDIVYLSIDKSVDSLEIDADDAEYTNHTYTYGDKNRQARINAKTRIFYNGCELSEGYSTSLLTPKSGTIKLSDSSDGAYKVLKITDYTDCVVDSVNETDSVIYDKYSFDNALSYGDLNYVLTDKSGKALTVDALSNGSVLSYAVSLDKKKARIIACDEEISGTLSRIDTQDSTRRYTIGDSVYEASPQIEKKLSGEARVGDVLTVKLNFMGKIASYDKDGEGASKFGYLIKAAKGKSLFDNNMMLKILTEEDGVKTIETAEKITFDGKSGVSSADCLTKLSEGQLILYKNNSSGQISEIDTAYTDTVQKEEKESENSLYKFYDGSLVYNKASNTFSGTVTKASDARIFFVPQNPDTAADKEFTTDVTFSDKQSYRLAAYRVSADSFYADAIVVYERGNAASLASNSALFMVKSVYEGLNADGETVPMLSGYSGGSQKELELYEKCRIITPTETRIMTDEEKSALSPGDIIRIATDSKKRLSVLEMIWDKSEKNPYCMSKNPTSDTYAATYRFMYGTVHSADSSYFRITFENDAADAKEADMQAFLKSKVLNYYIYEENRDGTWFRKGTSADIVPWKNNLSNPSKVLIRQYYGTPEEVIIFN